MLNEALSLEGPPRKVAIVTGGSRGLGREMARSLALAGAEVCIASRTEADLRATAEWLQGECGREVLAVPTNVQSSADCDALIEATIERFGRLDIMVNNAGIGDRRGAGAQLWDITDDDWQDTVEVNLHSTFYCTRRAARQFRDQGEGGVIINVASGTALRSYSNSLGYAAAKAGVISLTKSTASMLAGEDVRVNCIIPGFIVQAPPETDEQKDTIRSRGRFNPAGRLGEAWELGPLAVFLASDASSYVTGESFVIDGGGIAGGIAPTGWDVTGAASNG
ncbi:MAG: SDR family oxidoreductase [Dehalococcoidia bacterium]|nr:SDR family oxidoreductase [Dehalococcoidia bacterium]